MDFYIVSIIDNKQQLGTENQRIIRNAKNMTKVNNALKYFKPFRKPEKIEVYSFTNFYNESTFKLIKTINNI